MRWSSVCFVVMKFVFALEKFLARAESTAAAKNTPPPHQCLLDVVLQASRMRLDTWSVKETCDASNESRSCSYWPIGLSLLREWHRTIRLTIARICILPVQNVIDAKFYMI